ncbi:MAG: hypothetical protein ACE5OZ_17750 [Candidatus Heimdallarchaeota archaeon]
MTEKTYCPHCGTLNFPGDQFCATCGKSIAEEPSSPVASSSRISEYRGYIRVVGTVEVVFGVLYAVLGVFTLLAAIFVTYVIGEGESGQSGGYVLGAFVGAMILVVAIMFLALGIYSIKSGKQLIEFRESGRTGTMIVAAINLINIPFGTIFGIAALYVLTRPEIEGIISQ